MRPALYCSFCGISQHEVELLVAGPQVFICSPCVEICNDIIRKRREDRSIPRIISEWQHRQHSDEGRAK